MRTTYFALVKTCGNYYSGLVYLIHSKHITDWHVNVGSYSCKQLSASFRSEVNFFATEVYGATFLLVALSWTGFWVDPRRYGGGGAAIRLGLGLLTVLILVVYGVGFRLLHNKVFSLA